jgi:hypothetical protein
VGRRSAIIRNGVACGARVRHSNGAIGISTDWFTGQLSIKPLGQHQSKFFAWRLQPSISRPIHAHTDQFPRQWRLHYNKHCLPHVGVCILVRVGASSLAIATPACGVRCARPSDLSAGDSRPSPNVALPLLLLLLRARPASGARRDTIASDGKGWVDMWHFEDEVGADLEEEKQNARDRGIPYCPDGRR